MSEQFPSNSNEGKPPAHGPKPPEKKEFKKVVTGEVIVRKKPPSRRFKEFFTGQNAKETLVYVWTDILIPGTKELVLETVTSGMEKRFFGEARSRRRGPAMVGGLFGNAGYTAYNRMTGPSGPMNRPDPRQGSTSLRGRVSSRDIQEIILPTRAQGQEVLDQLIWATDQYGSVTVADLWDILEVTGEFTDDKWGWTDLMGADVVRVHEGYLLDLPRPIPLER